MPVYLIDAHSHIQDERLFPRIGEAMQRAKDCGVVKIVSCGTQEQDWGIVESIKKRYPEQIIASFGLHPWYIGSRSRNWLDSLRGLLSRIPSGVGEIGLDLAIPELDLQEQKDVFRAQLELARQYKRPVSIHCRRAWEALFEILREYGPLEAGGLIHSYSGAAELIPELNRLGLSISFSGSITRSGNKRGQRALASLPFQFLLIETDSPDIMPVGVDGFNEPANLVLVAMAVANLRSTNVDEIARITSENAKRLFCGEILQG